MSGTADGWGRATRLERLGLWLFLGFTGLALAGYATFGRNPSLLMAWPQMAEFYAVSFHFFAQAHVWLGFVLLALVLTRRVGFRWVGTLAAVYAISLTSELLGTTVGLPFGEYRYTEGLGAKWFDHVPVVIPLSWFSMAIPAYVLAMRLLPGVDRVRRRILLASLVLLIWDLALDPAMSFATSYWVWEATGPYYGMPWLNLFGWYVTGLALMGAIAATGGERVLSRVPVGWSAGYYGVNLLLPLGMSAVAGLWVAVLATAAAGGLGWVAAVVLGGRGLAGVRRTWRVAT